VVVGDDVVADFNALVADEHSRAGDELPNVVLVLVAEGAPQDLSFPGLFHHTAVTLSLSAFSARLSAGPQPTVESCQLKAAHLRPFTDDIVNDTVFLPLIGRHDVVALGIVLDTLQGLACVMYQDFIDPLTHSE